MNARIIPQQLFNEKIWDKNKKYGSFSSDKGSYVVGPFSTTAEVHRWLDANHAKNPTYPEDYYSLDESDILQILKNNKEISGSLKP